MHSLRELQQDLARSFLTGHLDLGSAWVQDTGVPVARRLKIYRNNVTSGFHSALAAGFPVLLRLVGADFFLQLAREYQDAHPSPSGNLHYAGSMLPRFLERKFSGTDYEYFGEVAALEWICQNVMIAGDCLPLDVLRLSSVEPETYPRLRFELSPAAGLMASRYPIFTIWSANRAESEPESIDLASGGEQVLICREGEGVMLYRLPRAEYECLAALRAARPLGRALEFAPAADSAFDLRATLARWVSLGVIVDFSILGDAVDA